MNEFLIYLHMLAAMFTIPLVCIAAGEYMRRNKPKRWIIKNPRCKNEK